MKALCKCVFLIGTVSQVSDVAHGRQIYQSKRVDHIKYLYAVTHRVGVTLDICTLSLC